jgi:hypothetical protein
VPGFPTALSHLIMKSLAKTPTDRFQTAEEFLLALESVRDAAASFGIRRPPASTTSIHSAILNRMKKCLALAVGPIARASTSRTARGVQDVAVLRRMLAEQIPEESTRQAFLKCCDRPAGGTMAWGAPPEPRRNISITSTSHAMARSAGLLGFKVASRYVYSG